MLLKDPLRIRHQSRLVPWTHLLIRIYPTRNCPFDSRLPRNFIRAFNDSVPSAPSTRLSLSIRAFGASVPLIRAFGASVPLIRAFGASVPLIRAFGAQILLCPFVPLSLGTFPPIPPKKNINGFNAVGGTSNWVQRGQLAFRIVFFMKR